jgi:membrane associated rhomboid family serine protease
VQLLIVIGLNLALGFFVSGVAWQAHVGGLVIGVAAGLILVRTRRVRQRRIQLLLLGALALLLAVLTVARFLI